MPGLLCFSVYRRILTKERTDAKKFLGHKRDVPRPAPLAHCFFLFFWTFSPSAGTPFLYYSRDVLLFDKMFYGIVGAVSGVSSILGACIFAKFQKKIKQKKIINLAIFFGAALGGWLFDRIGLQPLIIVSALFSALSWFIVPYLKLEEKKGE